MGNTLMTLLVKLGVDTGDFNSGLDNAEKKSHNSASNIASGLSGIGGGLVAGIGIAGAAIGAFGVTSMQAAMDSENAMTELNAVIKSTGGIAGVTTKNVTDYAEAMQKVTKFDDEAIIGGQSMLLTFTKIGKDVFPDASTAMLNMAEKFGSMETASTQLGKALNDPIAGVGALRRIGVTLSDEQEEQIKGFMAVNDIASAQKIILGELNTEFGGLAEAAGKTSAGNLAQLQNSFNDIQEKIGGALLPLLNILARVLKRALDSPQVKAGINFIVKKLDELTGFVEWLSGFQGWSITDLFTTGDDNTSFLSGLFEKFGMAEEQAQDLANKINGVVQWVIQNFGWLATELETNQGVIVGILAALGTAIAIFAIGAAVSFLTAFGPALLVMALVGVAAYLLYTAWTENWGGIQEKTAAVWAWLEPKLQDIWDWMQINIPLALQWLADKWKEVWDGIQVKTAEAKTYLEGLFHDLSVVFEVWKTNNILLFEAFWDAVHGDWQTAGEKLGQMTGNTFDLLDSITSGRLKSLGDIWNFGLDDILFMILNVKDWKGAGVNMMELIKQGFMFGLDDLFAVIFKVLSGLATGISEFVTGFMTGQASTTDVEKIITDAKAAAQSTDGVAPVLRWYGGVPVDTLDMSPVNVVTTPADSSQNARVEELLQKLLDKPGIDEKALALGLRDALLMTGR